MRFITRSLFAFSRDSGLRFFVFEGGRGGNPDPNHRDHIPRGWSCKICRETAETQGKLIYKKPKEIVKKVLTNTKSML